MNVFAASGKTNCDLSLWLPCHQIYLISGLQVVVTKGSKGEKANNANATDLCFSHTEKTGPHQHMKFGTEAYWCVRKGTSHIFGE